ncbi:hypothetical protein T484DRAFT_1858199 [Baffinella frigidus]|nr:hypothetical protein T484DRAFT_1858199 [Cryptophyta sp. CCMP2293]
MGLVAGAGGEGDTLAAKTVLVYDTARLPFHQAEVSQQFHDDMSVSYGETYNALRQLALKDGLIHETTCPDLPQ